MAWSEHDVAALRAYLNQRWGQRHDFTAEEVAGMRRPLDKAKVGRQEALDSVDRLVDEGFAFVPTAVEIVNAAKRLRAEDRARRTDGRPTFLEAEPDYRDAWYPWPVTRYIVVQPDGQRVPRSARAAGEEG